MRLRAQALTAAALLLAGGAAAAGLRPAGEGSTARSLAFCSGVDVADLERPYVFRYGLSGDDLQSQFFDQGGLNGVGYRPRRLTGYRTGSEQLFATKWVKAPGPQWSSRFGLTGSQFNALFRQLRSSHRPTDVSGYNTPGGAVRHAVIWERNTPRVDWRLHRDVSRAGMDDLVDGYAKTGFVPLRVEAYTKSGRPRYVSIWVKTACNWRMHNRMTRAEYQSRLDGYAKTHRLVHLDSFVDGGSVYYAGIWWRQPGPGQDVRSDRDWYAFQRVFNNNACLGRVIDNFHATDVPGAIRYGGIWTSTGAPAFGGSAPLESRIRQEVNCAPARAGAAVTNLTTGQQILVHADVAYGTSSTIKSAILFAVLRKIDATDDTLDTLLPAGTQYGTQRGSPTFRPRFSYPLRTFATKMIRSSCNWATNRLIDYVGMEKVNTELRNLGLQGITLRRYMTGTGAPGAQPGSTGASDDYGDGFDNTATP
ncbi:MAG: serine hydrolase, partial [Gaiellaceae bacterium]